MQKIKDIYSGAYNAYFNNNSSVESLRVASTFSEDVIAQIEGAFKFYLTLNTFLSQSIIEARGTEVLINSYNLTSQFDLSNKFQDYKDSFPEETHETMESIFSQITQYEIYGQQDDAVYNKYIQTFVDGSVSASLTMELKIEYKDDSDYCLTVIATYPSEPSFSGEEEIQVIIFDRQKGEIEFYNLESSEVDSDEIVKSFNTVRESFGTKPSIDL